ncbi:MAG: polyprenyl synthetase family protein [bacterium]
MFSAIVSRMNISRDIANPYIADKSDLLTVRELMTDILRATSLAPIINEIGGAIDGGKLLRARLALKVGSTSGVQHDSLLRAAAAVEMVHAASLLHDDVIDGGHLRRGSPTFWKKKGVSGAILLGDLMVCKALQLLNGKGQEHLVLLLVRLAGEMCDAEVEQELISRGTARNWEKCVSIARRKTGSLFAFAAASAGSGTKQVEALMEAGYCLGTAFQLADDLMDACGDKVRDGKNLGTDAQREKPTSISSAGGSVDVARACIQDLCTSSSAILTPWSHVKQAWDEYLHTDFSPVVSLFAGEQVSLTHACAG